MTRTQLGAFAAALAFILTGRLFGWDIAALLASAVILGRFAGLWLNSRRV